MKARHLRRSSVSMVRGSVRERWTGQSRRRADGGRLWLIWGWALDFMAGMSRTPIPLIREECERQFASLLGTFDPDFAVVTR